jgi:hypothetical protein
MHSDETGGADPLDRAFDATAPATRPRAIDILLRTRAALGLEPLTAPALLFVPLGMLLGPTGVGLLSRTAIGHAEALVALALAALGIFIGMALDGRGARDGRLLAVATIEAATAFGAVFGAALYLLHAWGLPLDLNASIVAVMLGVAASVSAAGAVEASSDARHRLATRIADLDDGIAVIGAAVAIAALRAPTAIDVAVSLLVTIAVGLLAGMIGWLLFERARSPSERAVFVLGAIALAGGGAVYAGGSALLSGGVAGLAWRRLPGDADRIIRADVGRFQRPLVVLLLVIAGALVELTSVVAWLLALFVVFRLAGKVLGALVGSRFAPVIGAADLAAYLVPPGLLGIALAITFAQVSPSPAAIAVASAVTLGTLASELLALAVLPGGPAE